MNHLRTAFEEWISAPPIEADIDRWPEDCDRAPWPGNYKKYPIQLAWEAWQEGYKHAKSEGQNI